MSDSVMNTVWIISMVMLQVAFVLTSYRVFRGPSTLDRLVGVDTPLGEDAPPGGDASSASS